MSNKKSELPYKSILQKCKENLEMTKFEHEQIKLQTAIMYDKIHQVGQKTSTIEKEERLLRKDNDEWEYFLSEKQTILKLLQSLIEIQESKDHSFELDYKHHPQYPKIQNNEKGIEIIQDILRLETTNVKLEGLLQELGYQYKKLYQSGALWNCVRCGLTLKEGKNEETCIYHPGKLKYYSCRTCGGDEYFTCCNTCRDCLPGCTKGLHKPG